MTTLPDIARASNARRSILPPEAPVLVMVSGGGDSVALLHLLAKGELGEHPVRVLHVNHMLRGQQSDADEAFVADLCARLDVACRTVRYDVAEYAQTESLNLEDAGRRVRYRFAEEELDAWLESLGRPARDGRIATAHTRDDRIETFFTRAIAGSGSGALSSIAAVRGRVVRPLIDCDRSQVRAWLASAGLTWREDESNDDTTRARALVRANLVPVAETLNPAFRSSLARTMDLLADDDELLTTLAETFALQFAEVIEDERVTLERTMMGTLDRTMQRRVVRVLLARAFPDVTRIEAAHVETVVDGLASERFAHDLPGGLRAVSEYDTMVISRSDAEDPRVAPSLLSLPGSADLGPAGTITASCASPLDTSGDPHSIVIDAGAVRGELTIDAPREGDRLRPLGMEGTRKLSDLLIDAKVARRLRSATPVVRDGDRVVWVAGVRMSDEYKVDSATTVAYRLEWTPKA